MDFGRESGGGWGVGLADGLAEGVDEVRVFDAPGRFDAGGDVHGPRMKQGDGVGDIVRGQAAGQDPWGDVLEVIVLAEELGQAVPVESLPVAAGKRGRGGGRGGVDQDGQEIGGRGQPEGKFVLKGVWGEVKRFDDGEGG